MSISTTLSNNLQPPFQDAPLAQSGDQHSQAWTRHTQDVADRINGMWLGVSDGSDAAAGQIGEFVSSVVVYPGVAIANNIPGNVTSLPLTAGDWDVRGEVWFQLGTGVTGSLVGGISTASASIPTPGTGSRATIIATFTTNSGQVLALAPSRVSLAAAATVYLVALCGFNTGSTSAYGRIEARRVR